MNATTAGLAAATILLWGAIPILDKAALALAPSAAIWGMGIRAAAAAVVIAPLVAWHSGTEELQAMPPFAVALYVASGVASLVLGQYAYYALLQQAAASRVYPLVFGLAPLITVVIAA